MHSGNMEHWQEKRKCDFGCEHESLQKHLGNSEIRSDQKLIREHNDNATCRNQFKVHNLLDLCISNKINQKLVAVQWIATVFHGTPHPACPSPRLCLESLFQHRREPRRFLLLSSETVQVTGAKNMCHVLQ